jgi:hypothetical protein
MKDMCQFTDEIAVKLSKEVKTAFMFLEDFNEDIGPLGPWGEYPIFYDKVYAENYKRRLNPGNPIVEVTITRMI